MNLTHTVLITFLLLSLYVSAYNAFCYRKDRCDPKKDSYKRENCRDCTCRARNRHWSCCHVGGFPVSYRSDCKPVLNPKTCRYEVRERKNRNRLCDHTRFI